MGGEIVGSTTNWFPGNPDPLTSGRRSFSLASFLSPNRPSSSSSSSSSSSNFTAPLLANSAQRLTHGAKDEIESQRSNGSFLDSVFWSVPTRIEVENAIAALQSFMRVISPSRSDPDRFRPILSHIEPRILQSPGFQRVYDAFLLLQTVPSVQRMVTSLSSDIAVWNAVLNNNEVQRF